MYALCEAYVAAIEALLRGLGDVQGTARNLLIVVLAVVEAEEGMLVCVQRRVPTHMHKHSPCTVQITMRFGTFWEGLPVWELWGDEPPPTYFEGGEFISEGLRSPFDDVTMRHSGFG